MFLYASRLGIRFVLISNRKNKNIPRKSTYLTFEYSSTIVYHQLYNPIMCCTDLSTSIFKIYAY